MAPVRRPFVAIIGGFWELKNDLVAVKNARETGAEIGAALAQAEMGLVVYLSHEDSLEPYVVSGYVKTLPPGATDKLIRVRFAESQRNIVKFAEQETRRELFDLSLFAGQEWEAPFYRSLVSAEGVDAVLLMAGGRSTLIAGQIAVARPLPVLAMDKFDGSAAAIRTELAIGSPDYPSSATHSTAQAVAWLKAKCKARAEQQAQERSNEIDYVTTITQKEKTIWSAGAFFMLLLIVLLGAGQKPTPAIYPFLTFSGLVAAGATGALVRSLIWGAAEMSPATSLLLGGVAGFVVGLAYLIPQWVGAPGFLIPSATIIKDTDKIQFVSAVLVALSAGVGFDTVFTRLKKEAEEQSVAPPLQKRGN